MILCSCTGLNSKILEQAIDGGATRISQVYKLATETNGSKRNCSTPEQVIQCTKHAAKAWQEYAGDDTPESVLKIINKKDKDMSKENGEPCQNNCPGCTCSQAFLDQSLPKKAQVIEIPVIDTTEPETDKQPVKLAR